MHEKIRCYMAPGEADRERSMRSVLSHDIRFEPLQIDPNNTVDLFFRLERECWSDSNLHIELKRPADFIQSVLSGHLYDQTLSIRESGYNGCTVVLGTLDEIYAAIDESNEKRLINGKFKFLNRDDRSNANASTLLRLKSFKKRSFLNGVPVMWKGDDSGFFDGDDQWKDILDLAADYLLDGSLMGFRMRPPDNEREICAAAMLYKGIGDSSMRLLLTEYELRFCPKPGARSIEEIPGFGKKRCDQIRARVNYK